MKVYENKKVLKRGWLFTLVAAMMVFSLLPSYLGETTVNEYTVIVLTEAKEYEVGDQVTIEIHFFKKDVPVDAHDVNISLGYPEWGYGRYIEVDEEGNKVETGVYRVSFTYQEDDIPYGKVVCTVNEEGSRASEKKAEANFYLMIKETGDFSIEIKADKTRPSAGETVRFSITFMNGTEKVDPDQLNLAELTVNQERQDIKEELVKDGVGEYHYDYQLAEDNESKVIELSVQAYYNDDYESERATVILDYYQIWIYKEKFSREGFEGKIGVCQLDGKGVEADIYLQYSYKTGSGNEVKNVTGRTNSNGLMDVSFNLSSVPEDVSYITLEIWANTTASGGEGYHQYVKDEFFFEDEEGSAFSGEGFEIVTDEDYFLLSKKSEETTVNEVTSTYTAYWNGTPLSNKEIYYYIFFGSAAVYGGYFDGKMGEIYAVGEATTDQNGKFTLTFKTPNKPCVITGIFKTEIENWQIFQTWQMVGGIYVDEDITINLDNFGFGKKVQLTATKPGLKGGKGAAFIGPIDKSVERLEDFFMDEKNWKWTKLNEEVRSWEETEFTGDSFTTEVGVPAFFPEDMNYMIIVNMWVEDPHSVEGGITYTGYIIVDKDGKIVSGGDNLKEEEEEDQGGFLPGFEALPLLMAGVGTYILFKKKEYK